jgi:hypothetical protein
MSDSLRVEGRAADRMICILQKSVVSAKRRKLDKRELRGNRPFSIDAYSKGAPVILDSSPNYATPLVCHVWLL